MHRLRPLAASLSILLALCLLGLWSARSQTGGIRRVTTTTDEGISINPSLSGDGRRIAFESTEDIAHAGGSDRFRALRADLSSDPAAFVQMGAARAPSPGISQDGSIIAFAAREDPLGTNHDGNSEIFLYDGAALRQITNTTANDISRRTVDGNYLPSLSDDGRFIAFSSNRNLAGLNADGNFEIFVFDTSAGGFTQLTNTAGTIGATDAKISGNGTRVAYIRDNGAQASAQRDLILQERATGVVRLLAAGVTNLAMTFGRAISDDGLRVAYSGDIAPNSSQVFLFDGRTANATRQITTLGARETDVPLHPGISGDGTRISFATRRPVLNPSGNTDNSIELYTYDIPTGSFARVTNALRDADGFNGSNRVTEVVSSLNDDGSIVAFNFPRLLSGEGVTEGLENNSEIYVTGTAVRPTSGSLTVLNEASFGHEPSTVKAVAPDSNAVALGNVLAFTTRQAPKDQNGNFPTTFEGTTVTVNGRRAQISFVSPTQVNFIVPHETELGTAEVIVTNVEGFQSRGTVAVLNAAPGIFTRSGDGVGEGVVLDADTGMTGPFDPTNGQLRLVIFTTGVRHATQVTATAGGRALTVESFMASPDMPGMDEVHVLVPADLRGAGNVILVIRTDNTRDSNPVTVNFSGNPCRDIVINEVLADPPDGPSGDANHDGTRSGSDDEFVELVNTTGINLNIGGYQLLTRSSTASTDTVRYTFAPGTLFPAGSAIVIFGGGNVDPANPLFGGAQVFKASSSSGLSLTNTGGVVTLRDASQTIVNVFTYGGATGLDGDANQSLTRSPDAGQNSECGNFVLHSTAPGSVGAFSPGTRVNGTPFARGLGQLSSVTISPPSLTIAVGQTTQFTAQALDQFGRPMTNVTITFASDNTTVATVDGVTMDTTTGVATATVTGRSEGTAHITASATDGTTTVTSNQATLTVNPLPAVVTRVEVAPPSASINRGQTQQFTATAFDQNNQPIPTATFTWSSSDPNVATVNATGLATGTGLGSATITAMTSDATGTTVSGTATLTVQVPLVINEIHADVAADNVSTPAVEGDANRDGVRDSEDDEFIELLNNSNAPVDISGVIIADATSNRYTIPANTTLAAGRALVIFGGGTPPVNDPAFGGALVLAVTGSGTLSLNDSGDTVNVKLNFGGSDHLITSVTYGSATDQSLTRSPDAEVGTTGGSFVSHTTATNAAGRTFSPGTRADGTPFGSPAITRIEVLPVTAAIDVGATQVYTATAYSNVGGPEVVVPNVSFIWDSSDTTKATVAPTTGQTTTARGVSPGTNITIRARAGGQQGSGLLTVNTTPPVLTSVTISPTSATINAGQTQQFTGQALDQFGQPIGGVTVTFASNNTTVATVDSVTPTSGTGSATATVTGHTNGTAQITASATNGTTTVNSSPATLTVAPVANPGDVVISEFRTRGPNGANDEFIELYNRTTAAIDISGYKIFRSNNTGATNLTATINSGVVLGPGCHYLLTNSNSSGPYSGSVPGDQTYGTGITADGGIALTIPGGTATTGIIDQVGLSSGSAYKEGTPLAPFAGDAEQSYERKPGGASGNGTDTNNNAADFLLNSGTSNPQNLSSGCLDLTKADLSITKTDSPDPVVTGTDVTYTITVTNSGPADAQSVVVTDDLPGSVTFVSCNSTGGGVCGGTGNNRTVTFPSLASGASATITLVATANSAAGTTITNTATVASATADSNTANNSATATTTVSAPLPTLSIDNVTLSEGNTGATTFSFTVSLSTSAPAGGVTFDIATADGTAQDDNPATEDNDYVARSLTGQTIPEGQQTYTFDVTVNGDTLVENDETFNVNVTNVSGAILSDGLGVGTIQNDDAANLVISQVYGGGNNSSATFQRDFIEIFNRGTTTVNFAITPYSVQYASSGAPFGTSKTDLTSGTIAPGRYFLIQEAGGTTTGAPLPTPDATGSIAMGNTSGKVALVFGTTLLPEEICPGDDGATPFNPNNGAIVDFVGYGSVSCYEGPTGPAPAPSNTTADFRRGGGCQDTNDNAADFFVQTPNPRNSLSPANSCTAGVTPDLTITDATVTEGNSGTVTATFTVQLSAPAQGADVTFDIATADNTATVANSDYAAKSLPSQIIPAGQQTYTFTVTVNGDTAVEPNETFFVNVTNVVGATATDGQGVGTIQNDDLPTLSINDVSQAEGTGGTTTFTFTVSLSVPAPGTVTFDIATQDNTATDADNDYEPRILTNQTIAANSQTYTFDVTVNGDAVDEPSETFFVNVTNVNGATTLDGQGLGTILNDDATASVISVTVSPSSATINRGQTQQFTATAFDAGNQPVAGATFTWSSSNTNVATIDANGLATGVGIGTTTITATTSDGIGGNVSGTATLNVQVPLVINEIHADVAPDNVATTDVIEGDANRDGVRDSDDDEFVELLNNSNAPVDLSNVVITDAANAATSRYTFPAGTTLAAGRAVVVFGGGTPPVNDPAFGGALVFAAPGTLSLNDGGDTVTVKLNVGGTDVQIAQVVYASATDQSVTRSPDAEIGTTGGSFVSHTTATNAAGRTFSPGTRADGTPFGSPAITRIEVLPATASVNIGATQTFTATAYSNVGGPEVIVPNVSFIWDSSDTTKATVAPTTGQSTVAKGIAAGSSTIRARAGGQQGTAALTINAPLTISIDDVTHNEGASATTTIYRFTVSLSAPATSTVTFDIATQDNTATDANNDYEPRSLTNQMITAGNQFYTFDVTVNGDDTVESTETFFVNVTNVTGATLTGGDGQGVGTITNDDAAPAVIDHITVTPASATIVIGGTQQFTAQAFDASNNALTGVTFTWNSSNPGVATIDGNGLATGVAAGTTQITATSGSVTSSAATLTVAGKPATDELVINEVFATPANGNATSDANRDGDITNSRDEFVEILNVTTVPLDLSGLRLYDGTTTARHLFPANTILQPGKAIVVFGGESGTAASSNIPGLSGTNAKTATAPNASFGGSIVQVASTFTFGASTSSALDLNNTGDSVRLVQGTLTGTGAGTLTVGSTFIAQVTYPSTSVAASFTRLDTETGGNRNFVSGDLHPTISNASSPYDARRFSPGFRRDGNTW
ncbi:MAG TPA: lamin tail domain-containing protein [Pyrinomonadaceae bacterium]|nr:lamin tail domain-containing protein [Pyrinomonadaceae bacterium]